jgi:hypothetical protein
MDPGLGVEIDEDRLAQFSGERRHFASTPS